MNLFLALLSLATAVALLPYVTSFPSSLVEDDGFFYAKIATNIATTGKSTFDGIHETSGYHLLWAGVLATTARLVLLVSSSRLVLFCAFLFVNLWITYVYVFAYFRWGEARLFALLLAVLGSFLTETGLLVLLLLPFFDWFLRYEGAGSRRLPGPLVFLCLFLVPLTRIDATAMVLLPLGYFLWNDRRLFLRLGVAVVLGMVAHFGLMLFCFGHLYSVSSYLKASAVTSRLWDNLSPATPGNIVRHMLVFGLTGAAAYIAWRRRSVPVAIIILSIWAFYGPHLLVSDMRHWYFLPVLIPLAFLVFRYRRDLPLPWAFTPAIYAVCAFLLLAFYLHYQILYANDRINSRVFIAQVNQITDENDVIYQVDGSGYIGYFLKAHVVNGDGLVNSYAYADRRRRNALAGYLDEIHADYIIRNTSIRDDWLVDFHGLKVPLADVDRVLAVPLPPVNQYCVFSLYRLRKSGTMPSPPE